MRLSRRPVLDAGACVTCAGPEQPAGGPTNPAPGSAIWVKEATRPGGAAAAAAPAGSDGTDAVLDTDSKKGELA